MNKKILPALFLFVLISGMLLSACGGSIPDSMYRSGPPTRSEKPAVQKPDPGVAVFLDEPAATDVESTATFEPTAEDEPSLTNEPIATDVPAEAGQIYPGEPEATEEPIEGFWASSDRTGHIGVVTPKDWEWIDEYNPPPYNDDGDERLLRSTISSPDRQAYIHFLEYENRARTVWVQAFVRETFIRLLNQIHSPDAQDVKVLNYKPMPDGSEQAVWVSRSCLCTGTGAYKVYKTHMGTELLIFSISYKISAKDMYLDIIHYVLGTLRFFNE